ncbi:MAG: hypothetical protein GC155_16885 [Alphaproteobacteria bacterium]|nr:hypothetical protein [Alphaproteobacteria bacterium]
MDARNADIPVPPAAADAERKDGGASSNFKAMIGERLARRPVTTAAVAALAGAFAAEAIALFFTRMLARMALRQSARANLRLARDLDPDPGPRD